MEGTGVDAGEDIERLAALARSSDPDAAEGELVAAGEVDSALDAAFAHLAGSFDAGKARNAKGTFQHEIVAPDGTRQYYVHVEGGACEVGPGTMPDPDLTISIRLADMLGLATGVLSGDDAFKLGKLRLSGNPFLGMKLPEWFRAVR